MTDYAAFWDEKPVWVEVLLQRLMVGTLRGVASELGVSHSLVIKCLRHERAEDELARKVMEKWGEISCEAFGDEISVVQCEVRQLQPCPTHNPMAMQHWKACLQCPRNKQQGGCDAKRTDETHRHPQARQALLVGVPGAQGVGVRR